MRLPFHDGVVVQDDPTSSSFSSPPRHLKTMRPEEVSATLALDARMIVPVGNCAPVHPSLPFGCTTLIVEQLADDLSAEFGVLRAPTVEYGVNPERNPALGYVSLHKKTLHRLLNDMLASWENHGVTEFILLTAHTFDPHREALGTVGTVIARVRAVDIFAVHYNDLLQNEDEAFDAVLPLRALCQHLTPSIVQQDAHADSDALASLGARLYDRIRTRISDKIFRAPVLAE